MNRYEGWLGEQYVDGKMITPRNPPEPLPHVEAHDTEPAPPPVPYDPTSRRALAKVDWQRVPPEVSAELYSLLAYRCRQKAKRGADHCFCGCHEGTPLPDLDFPDNVPIRAPK